jgi:hypothetical protein
MKLRYLRVKWSKRSMMCLFFGTSAIWLFSYFFRITVTILPRWPQGIHVLDLHSTGGELLFYWSRYQEQSKPHPGVFHSDIEWRPRGIFYFLTSPESRNGFAGVAVDLHERTAAFDTTLICVPWYAIFLVMLALNLQLIINQFIARKSRRWRRIGHCAYCGYDLRGAGDCCPECGSPKSSETSMECRTSDIAPPGDAASS